MFPPSSDFAAPPTGRNSPDVRLRAAPQRRLPLSSGTLANVDQRRQHPWRVVRPDEPSSFIGTPTGYSVVAAARMEVALFGAIPLTRYATSRAVQGEG